MYHCPKDNAELEFISGDFTTGVTHPDGTAESCYEEGLRCTQCGTIFEESDIEMDDEERPR